MQSKWGAYLLFLEKKLFNFPEGKRVPLVSTSGGFYFLVPDKSSVWFMHIPQEERPVVKVTFGLSSFKMANYYCSNKLFSCDSRNS